MRFGKGAFGVHGQPLKFFSLELTRDKKMLDKGHTS